VHALLEKIEDGPPYFCCCPLLSVLIHTPISVMNELIQAELRRTHVRSETDDLKEMIIQLQEIMKYEFDKLYAIIDEKDKRIIALEAQTNKEEQDRINALEIKAHYLDHCRHASMNPYNNRPYIPYTPVPWKSGLPPPTSIPSAPDIHPIKKNILKSVISSPSSIPSLPDNRPVKKIWKEIHASLAGCDLK
jgi:hypothetical protein